MRARVAAAALAAAAVAGAAGLVVAPVRAQPDTNHVAGRIPAEAPPAARGPDPVLPAPAGWPFGEGFPRTAGTGRYEAGALLWTDYLYDDHGATSVSKEYVGTTRPRGGFTYPAGPAAGNGADVFRVGVGLDADASWWRVDWNTLVDPSVPVAAFGLDDDDDPATGRAWPGIPNLGAAGVDRALVVSGSGAWLVGPTGATMVASPGDGLTVDTAARSFVVRLPRSTLDPTGTGRLWLAAGLSGGDAAFAPVPPERGGGSTLPPVYNAAFRSVQAEPASSWADTAQATALAAGDVSAFGLAVDWDALGAGVTTPAPVVTGVPVNRWYASSIELAQGVSLGTSGFGTTDKRPDLLGRVVPYMLYVPAAALDGPPAPLTWLLHSFGTNHNQYAAKPRLLANACEARRSFCATPTGRGADGFNKDEAELDLWETWRAIAADHGLDPDRASLWGFSMGALGVYRYATTYPDVFAGAAVVTGPPSGGTRPYPGGPDLLDDQLSENTTPLLENLRWRPIYIAQAVADELNPVTGAADQLLTLDGLGYRYRYELYPAEDHVVWALKDGFGPSFTWLGDARRPAHAGGRMTYRWYPDLDRPDLGIGATGAQWARQPRARMAADGVTARMDGISHALPDPAVTPVRDHTVAVPGDPTPAVVRELTWDLGAAAARRAEIALDLRNVAAVTIDLARAGFASGEPGTATVTTDGATTIDLVHLPSGAAVSVDGTPATVADTSGWARVTLAAGGHGITWGPGTN